jgi:hypothetical protein
METINLNRCPPGYSHTRSAPVPFSLSRSVDLYCSGIGPRAAPRRAAGGRSSIARGGWRFLLRAFSIVAKRRISLRAAVRQGRRVAGAHSGGNAEPDGCNPLQVFLRERWVRSERERSLGGCVFADTAVRSMHYKRCILFYWRRAKSPSAQPALLQAHSSDERGAAFTSGVI